MHLFDLWEVRSSFQAGFNHVPYFMVAEKNAKITGLLALSWNDDTQCYQHFPGETWHGKTWLEQNRILAGNSGVLRTLIREIPDNTHIRYLTRESLLLSGKDHDIDETGFLFFPERYDFSFPSYMNCFSGKSRKKLARELEKLGTFGVSYRHNHWADVDIMFQMNLDAFGMDSFFSDARFLQSFENLLSRLSGKNRLRITTVMLNGKIAAVDVGALFRNTYTVLAGGTNPDFQGVAKIINFHHLEWSCRQRLEMVDFLCGDFGWKQRFHLTPRPLFQMHFNHCFTMAIGHRPAVYAAV